MCARVRDVTITMMIVLFIVLFQNQTSNTFGEGTYSIPETLVHPGKLDDARALEPERNWCYWYLYSTSPRNGNRVNGNHLEIFLSFSQKNGNSLTRVLVALTVCFTYPVLYRVSSESRAGEWEL